MKNRYSVPAVLALLLPFFGCSTAKVRIFPGEDGVNRVVSSDIEKDDAEEAAVKKANAYCDHEGKKMYVVGPDKTTYQGSMDEDTRKIVRNGSKVAMAMGGPVGLGTRNGTAGGVVGGAGAVGYGMTNDRDYQAEFTFKCK